MIKPEIMEAFIQCIDGHVPRYTGGLKSNHVVRRKALLLVKSVEKVLEHLCEHGLESITVQELYNEISGQAHFG